MGEATRNLPLSYRPDELDDWGTIRFAPDDEGRAWHALKMSMPTHDKAILDQHRRNGTDPCEEFGRKVVTAVNAHDDLVAALKECAALLRELCPRIPHDGPRNEEERIQYETIGGTFSHAERVISKATCS